MSKAPKRSSDGTKPSAAPQLPQLTFSKNTRCPQRSHINRRMPLPSLIHHWIAKQER